MDGKKGDTRKYEQIYNRIDKNKYVSLKVQGKNTEQKSIQRSMASHILQKDVCDKETNGEKEEEKT